MSRERLKAIFQRFCDAVCPKHARKWIARRFDVSTETAKVWIRDGLPYCRRAQLADAIDAEIPRLESEIDELEAIAAELRDGKHVAHVAQRARLAMAATRS